MSEQQCPLRFPFPRGESIYHPAPQFAELREHDPVRTIQTPDGNVTWIVTRYEDIQTVLTDHRFSRSATVRTDVPLNGLGRLSNESLLAKDGPEHQRLRKPMARALSARWVEQSLRPRTRALADDLLEGMLERGAPADLVEGFTRPFPAQVICELLGVPRGDHDRLHQWSDCIMGDWQSDGAELEVALQDFMDYFRSLIRDKRNGTDDDLLTTLLKLEDSEKLSEEELLNTCVGFFVAGHETTAAELNMAILELHRFGLWDELLQSPDSLPDTVDELLRFSQISASGGTLPRMVTEEVELGGVVLPVGAIVMTATPSGNRDGSRFDSADVLKVDRADKAHLTFGRGSHMCLGANVARMELQEALGGLLRHMPHLRPVQDESTLKFDRGLMIRSLSQLDVTW